MNARQQKKRKEGMKKDNSIRRGEERSKTDTKTGNGDKAG